MKPFHAATPHLVDASEIAHLVGLNRRSVIYFAGKGIIPCIRIGRHLRFNLNDIHAWLEAGGATQVQNKQANQ